MNSKQTNNDNSEQESSFSIKGFIDSCVKHWIWFLVSVVFFTGLGVVYVMRQQPKYLRTMSVLIKDQKGGGGAADIASSFSSLGLVSTNTNRYNELLTLLSPAVMGEVVQRLDLTMNYTKKGFPHGTTLYGATQPFIVKFENINDQEGASFRLDATPDGKWKLSKFVKASSDGINKFDKEIIVDKWTPVVNTPVGKVLFIPNSRYQGAPIAAKEEETYYVNVSAMQPCIESYSSLLKGDLADRDADIIDLSITDVNVERAVDILNSVLDVYVGNYIKDKNRVAVATSKFIDERLGLIEKELGVVDSDIMQYKHDIVSPDLEEAAILGMRTASDMDKNILEVQTQLTLLQYMADYINNPKNLHAVIPANSGIQNGVLDSQIANYNAVLMARNNIAAGSSANNPLVIDYDSQLKGLREAISRAIQSQISSYTANIGKLENAKGRVTGNLAAAPAQAKHLLSAERQQKVKEQLYLYLLQKREENELTQTFTADNTRVITPPQGSLNPVAPKKKMIVGIAFLIGLLFPALSVYIKESTNTKVRSRKDIEHISTPFIGEIPLVGRAKTLGIFAKIFKTNKKQGLEKIEYKVSSGSRDLINESFRIVRGNIDFMARTNHDKVIMITSFNPGSGKSFITYNLAASFAIKGKKVLIIDCDLRHGSASQYVGMPSKGITSYLTNASNDWNRLVVPVADQQNLYVLPIGHRPPNPAELLESEKMRTLVEEASAEFDYIFLDCPPVDIVVDTQVLAPLADKTIFVVRAGLLERTSVPEIDNLYKNARFKQMCILLNGTEQQFSRYGADGRGYYGSSYNVE